MINNKKITAVCTSRIYDSQHHIFLEQMNRHIVEAGGAMMIFALNSDLYWEEDTSSPECFVFSIIPYDIVDCVVIMDEKIKSRNIAGRIIAEAKKHNVPVLTVDGKYDGTPDISFDYDKGFESVVRHVIEGHSVKKPHFLAGGKGNKFSDARINIFRKVVEENGIRFDDGMVSYGEFWSTPARIAAEELIESGNIPDAVICANDIMAINVSDVFMKAGIDVPKQVIVTGFDGIDEALLATPRLTTAGCDSCDLAEAVFGCIEEIMSGRTVENVSVIPKLMPNASCGCEHAAVGTGSIMNDFNNRYYRYQDDLRMLYDITSKMQMSESTTQAASYLEHYITHDMCCVVDSSLFDSSKNYFTGTGMGSERIVFFDSYNKNKVNYPLEPGMLVPDPENRLNTGFPLIFNAIDFMSKPFGYICYSYSLFDINEHSRTASITNTVSMGLGSYVNMRFQRYLTDKMTAELKVAAQMQESMLPAPFAQDKRYEISASMMPAKNIGGDFYDYFLTDSDHLALVMADVSGKGVPAALYMATSKLVLHERALLPGTPAEIMSDVNREICENNKMAQFITIWFGILDLNTGIVTYANAGHEYPAVVRGSGRYEFVTSDNLPPIGADENIMYEDHTIDLGGGGSLFIYTDGVTDVKNAEGEHFGFDRMDELLNRFAGASPEDVIKGMSDGIAEFTANTDRFDDTTMLCVAFKKQ
ncbi:MAG: SpoIIE family protein phosphatase [Ruminiclostridium sp.]|nr:SpoIIE family protein phosphatase [Ruminiclostridium sp.]